MISILSRYLKLKSSGYYYSQNYKNYRKKSHSKTLNLFYKAAKEIPAYKDFLKKNKIKYENIKSIEDFKRIPVTTKENYIQEYDLKQRCWNGEITKIHTFAASSGSTGDPLFWPRDVVEEVEGAQIHELLFDKVYQVRKYKTLFINSFGLGNWIAGIYTEMCLYLMRLHGLPFTLASPGYNQEETFKVIKGFSHYFDQTIIACHPPILKMMVENGKNESIPWEKLNVKFLGAGEGFSENWRDYLLSLVGQHDKFRTIINIYGSADAGLMGFETPLSIALHRETAGNHLLNRILFKSERNPYLYQFDPLKKYIESVDDEIVLTMNSAMPLLRYNIHDNGSTLESAFLLDTVNERSPLFLKTLKVLNIQPKDWQFPFVYIFGRGQYMTSFYGVNIYPENIKAVLEHTSLQSSVTGRFVVSKDADSSQDPYMILRIELKPDVRISKNLMNKTRRLFVKILKDINSEYNQVEDKFKEKMHPKIILHKYNDPVLFPEGKIKKMG